MMQPRPWRYKYKGDTETFDKEEQESLVVSRPDQVLVKPLLVGICGSDLSKMAHKIEDPPIGHEWVGVVESIGDKVTQYSVGDTVTSVANLSCGECEHCLSGNAQDCKRRQLLGRTNSVLSNQILISESDLLKVPAHLSLESITLLEVAYIGDCAFHQASKLGMSKDHNIIIFGAGPIGLFTALALKERGYKASLVEVVPERIEAAKRLGFEATPFAKEMIERNKFSKCDVVFDCTGDSEGTGALKYLPIFSTMDGIVVIVGKYHKANLSETDFGIKALRLTWVANHQRENFKNSIEFWKDKITPLTESFVTLFSMDQINQAFAAAKLRKVLKVMLKQDEN